MFPSLDTLSGKVSKVDGNFIVRRVALKKLSKKIDEIRPQLSSKIFDATDDLEVIDATEDLLDAFRDAVVAVRGDAAKRGILTVLRDDTLRDAIDQRWTVRTDLQKRAFELIAESRLFESLENSLMDAIM